MQNKQATTTIPVELLRKYDRPGPRYTSYPTVPVWTEDVGVSAYKSGLKSAGANKSLPLAIYCHIPFCRRRCYYCGCNTCVSTKQSNADKYIDVVIKEIAATAKLLDGRNTASQLHFGGGTPTFLEIKGLKKIIDGFEKHFNFTEDYEKSIELDPRVTTTEQLDYLAGRGFNRASIGVQDFDSKVLEASGRSQTEKQIADILDYCRRLNFKGVNFDLIYGLPFQTVESFRQTLEKTIALRPDRLAVYSFAYLPQLKSNQTKINRDDLPSTETKYLLFALAVEMFTSAGYRQIGMDHFALPDDELSRAQSDGRLNRNFMGYTVQSSEEMIGFGMSAIGYIDNSFFQNLSGLDSYKNGVSDNDFAVFRGKVLSRDDLIRRYLITSLMCNFRFEFEQLRSRFDVDYFQYFEREHKQLQIFLDDNLLNISERALEISAVGRTFIRNIAMTYDRYLPKDGDNKKSNFSRTI